MNKFSYNRGTSLLLIRQVGETFNNLLFTLSYTSQSDVGCPHGTWDHPSGLRLRILHLRRLQ